MGVPSPPLPSLAGVVFVLRQVLFVQLWLAWTSCVDQAGLELALILLPSLSCWYYRCVTKPG